MQQEKDNLQYPDNLHNDDELHFVLFESYPHGQQGAQGSCQYSIALPMGAQSMITTAEAIYAEQEGLATMMTEAAAAVATGSEEFTKSVGAKGGPEAQSSKGWLQKLTDGLAGVVGEGGRQFLDKVDAGKRLAAGAFGVAANAKLSLLYTGPGKFRKFVFEFPMIAKNPNEAINIEKIIKYFRYSTLPGFHKGIAETLGATGDTAQAKTRDKGAGFNFYTFPSTWQISFGHKDKGAPDLTPFRIARSVCNSVLVNYAAAGVPFFFEDGKPFEVKMTLTFTETVIITKSLVEKGF